MTTGDHLHGLDSDTGSGDDPVSKGWHYNLSIACCGFVLIVDGNLRRKTQWCLYLFSPFSIKKVSTNHIICVKNLFTLWHVFFLFFLSLHLVQTWSVSSESPLAESLTHEGFFGVLGWSTNPSLWLLSDEQRLGTFPSYPDTLARWYFTKGLYKIAAYHALEVDGGSWKLHRGKPAPSHCQATVPAKFQTWLIRFGPRPGSKRDASALTLPQFPYLQLYSTLSF